MKNRHFLLGRENSFVGARWRHNVLAFDQVVGFGFKEVDAFEFLVVCAFVVGIYHERC